MIFCWNPFLYSKFSANNTLKRVEKSDTTATANRAAAYYEFVIYHCLHSNLLMKLTLGKLRKYLWNHCGLTPTLPPGIDVSSNFKSEVTQCCKFLWNTFWESLQQHRLQRFRRQYQASYNTCWTTWHSPSINNE